MLGILVGMGALRRQLQLHGQGWFLLVTLLLVRVLFGLSAGP